MYFTNYEIYEFPEIYGLYHMPLEIWAKNKVGFYFYRIHCRNMSAIDYVEQHIIQLAKKNENFYIFLDDTVEGYAYLNFKHVFEFVNKNNLKNKVIYASGHLKAKDEYHTWLEKKGLDSVFHVCSFNTWFWKIRFWTIECDIKSTIKKEVYYSCLNNRPREHRLITVTYLDYLNILEKGIVSANDKDYEGNSSWTFEEILTTRLKDISHKYNVVLKNQIPKIKEKLPLIVDVHDLGNKCLPHDLSPSVYNKALINLVTETFYFSTWNINSEFFITEKTWKAFTANQIPIIIGPKGIVKYLRELGFDMFDDIIDNSYDDEPDSTRLFSSVKSLKKVILTHDVKALSAKTEERRLQNFITLIKGIPRNPPVWEFLNENRNR